MEKYKVPIEALYIQEDYDGTILYMRLGRIDTNIFKQIKDLFNNNGFGVDINEVLKFKYNNKSKSIYLSYAVGLKREYTDPRCSRVMDGIENLLDLDDLLMKANELDSYNFPYEYKSSQDEYKSSQDEYKSNQDYILKDIFDSLGE